jgi:hypothetical protein
VPSRSLAWAVSGLDPSEKRKNLGSGLRPNWPSPLCFISFLYWYLLFLYITKFKKQFIDFFNLCVGPSCEFLLWNVTLIYIFFFKKIYMHWFDSILLGYSLISKPKISYIFFLQYNIYQYWCGNEANSKDTCWGKGKSFDCSCISRIVFVSILIYCVSYEMFRETLMKRLWLRGLYPSLILEFLSCHPWKKKN